MRLRFHLVCLAMLASCAADATPSARLADGPAALSPVIVSRKAALTTTTPIFIMTCDRVAVLKKAIASYHRAINSPIEIIIHDNNSTFPGMLAYLDELEAQGVTVVRSKQSITDPDMLHNVATTISQWYATHDSPYYIVTDPDIELEGENTDILALYANLLDGNPHMPVVGPMLRRNDIPDYYPLKDQVIKQQESVYQSFALWPITWAGRTLAIQGGLIDTAFGMYRKSFYFHRLNPALQTYYPYQARHLDWYLDPENLEEDQAYYLRRSTDVAHWSGSWLRPVLARADRNAPSAAATPSVAGATEFTDDLFIDIERKSPPSLKTPSWLSEVTQMPIGSSFEAPDNTEQTTGTLRALGFKFVSNQTWQRQADLLRDETLVLSRMEDLTEIDAIAVISIFRPYMETQYIYATLRSLFGALPDSAIINVLVGGADTDYVSPQTLRDTIGESMASRVHVIETPKSTTDYFTDANVHVKLKSGWNYARAVRSYKGSKNLLLCEDDIDVAPRGLKHVQKYLEDHETNVMTLFNEFCGREPKIWSFAESTLTVVSAPLTSGYNFPTVQSIIYSASLAKELGTFLILRSGRDPYDYLVGQYLAPFRTVLDYVYPSVVQHMGFMTTGLSAPGYTPRSTCYNPDM